MNPQQLQQMEEVSRLNNVGAALLHSGETNRAMTILRNALLLLSDGNLDGTASESFCSTNRLCASLKIPSHDESFYIYSNVLLLETSPFMDLEFTAACILFNMALAVHQNGMEQGQKKFLRRALFIYDLCLRHIHEMDGNALALGLCALNNQARLYYELGEFERFDEVLNALHDSLGPLMTMNNVNEESPFKPSDFEEMLLNTWTSKRPLGAPAA